MKKWLLFFCMTLSSLAQAQGEPFTISREETIPAPRATRGVQQIPLQIIVDQSSVWSRHLREEISKASDILKQCGVEIGAVQVKYVTYTPHTISALNTSNPYRGPSELILTRGQLSSVRPAMFLLGEQIGSTASATNRIAVTRMSQGTSVDVRPLLHTSLISGHHYSNSAVPGTSSSYSTFAHELAHILGNLEHADEPNNLMSSREGAGSKSGRLNPSQCNSIRQYSLINFCLGGPSSNTCDESTR